MVYVEASVRRRQAVAAARAVIAREGVADLTLRGVAAEAGVPLGTMQYAFRSKQELLRAVIEDVVGQISEVLRESARLEGGLAVAMRESLEGFWDQLVAERPGLQLMQYELTTYALRATGHEELARWQYEQYCDIVSDWCRTAIANAGESTTVDCAQLGRLVVAGLDGLIIQRLCAGDEARSREDLDALIRMLTHVSGVHDST